MLISELESSHRRIYSLKGPLLKYFWNCIIQWSPGGKQRICSLLAWERSELVCSSINYMKDSAGFSNFQCFFTAAITITVTDMVNVMEYSWCLLCFYLCQQKFDIGIDPIFRRSGREVVNTVKVCTFLIRRIKISVSYFLNDYWYFCFLNDMHHAGLYFRIRFEKLNRLKYL